MKITSIVNTTVTIVFTWVDAIITGDFWSCRGESKIMRIELMATFSKIKYSQNLLVKIFKIKLRKGLLEENKERD